MLRYRLQLCDCLRQSSRLLLRVRFVHRSNERLFASLSRFQTRRASDEGNVVMAKSRQVLNGLANSMQIIDADVAHQRSRGSYVDKNKRDLPQLQIFQQK